jgi:hypothetical protein
MVKKYSENISVNSIKNSPGRRVIHKETTFKKMYIGVIGVI